MTAAPAPFPEAEPASTLGSGTFWSASRRTAAARACRALRRALPHDVERLVSRDLSRVRIDAKAASSDSADASKATADSEKDQGGWVTLAEPKAKFDLLTLRDGKTALLGQKALPAGSYKSFRLILDPAQSSVTLKSGATVDVQWPGAGRSGIKVQLAKDVTVGKDSTKALVVDFDVGESFVMRGNAMKNGLLFKPVIKATTK